MHATEFNSNSCITLIAIEHASRKKLVSPQQISNYDLALSSAILSLVDLSVFDRLMLSCQCYSD